MFGHRYAMPNIKTRKSGDTAGRKIVNTEIVNAANGVARLLDTDQAAEYLGMGKRTLQEKMADREIGYVKIGKSVRFHPDDLEAFIERHRIKACGWKGGVK
ncbi:helix-turn-helix domain-containing protein [bacterium]|nr:helix-turn-helix domain-containing protein [bacterium]